MSILNTPAQVEAPKPFLKIREFPDETLQRKALPWLSLTADDPDFLAFKELVAAMVRTMEAAQALGIAGPQVGIPFRVFAIKRNSGPTLVAINPVLTTIDTAKEVDKEGCLSFPGISVRVERFVNVEMDYTDLDGNPQTVVLSGLEAREAQHEADHLDGVLFVDRIGSLAKKLALEELRRFRKIYPRRMEAYKRAVKSAKAKSKRK